MRQRILGGLSLVGAILLWLGRGVTEHMFFGWMVHELNPSISAIVEFGPPLFLAVLGLFLLYRGSSKTALVQPRQATGGTTSPATTPDVRTSKEEERIFVGASITPRYLLGFFEEHTGIQATQMTKPFVGKWMRLSGPLGEVLAPRPEYGAQLTFQKNDPKGETDWFRYVLIFMRFDPPWVDRLSILRRGDQLTVIGQIKTVEPLVLNLDHCELVD